MIEEHSAQGVAAQAAGALTRLHTFQPTFAEAITSFLCDPPAFGSLRVTVRNGVVAGVELTTTLAKA
jgi:hypothetical protein